MALFRGRCRFRRAHHHSEPDVFRLRLATRFGVRWTVGASADRFAFPVACHHPFGYVAAKVKDALFAFFTGSRKAPRFFQKSAWVRKSIGRFAQTRRVLRVRSVPRPKVEYVFS